jgi:CheY-like chemotaxis protein/anti-sigma regulatory factor (Ser/Thr protein kinase)
MLGDMLRIKQLLNNLLSNAFKYSEAGKVTLSIATETSEERDDKIILVVSVSDTGQGMTKEQVDELFDEYSRFNQEANRSTEGTGLGMSITNNLISLMNGEITVESELGKGSTFAVRLPQGLIDSDVLGSEAAENLRRFRTDNRAHLRNVQISREPMPYGNVLIVDDVDTNIYVAKGLLAPYDLKVDSADSGFAAIEKIKNGNSYDIIFMDHMMPKMDGIEATKIIRESGYTEPIVALTANAVAGQLEVFLENGFDDFISKPIDIRQMNAVLNKLIRDKQ